MLYHIHIWDCYEYVIMNVIMLAYDNKSYQLATYPFCNGFTDSASDSESLFLPKQ